MIIATAYDQYALEAFEANAVSYLLKPVNRERLAQAVGRASRIRSSETQRAEEQQRIRRAAETAEPQLQQIVARRRDRFVLLRLNQICFFEVENGVVRARTEDDGYWTNYQINDLESRLPDPPFFRAHRSVIVNMGKVREIAPFMKSSYLLIMNDRDSSEIRVSGRQAKKLRLLLQA